MIRILLLGFLLLLTSSRPALASGFNISSIGGASTNGVQMSRFWHTSLQPTLKGLAEPGQEVTISIDDQLWTTNADSSGEWVFTPVEALASGDHKVSVSNGASTINMTLALGIDNLDWEAASQTAETLPTVGFALPTLLLLGSGGTLIAAARRYLKRN